MGEILLASVVNLAVYLALYALWGALLAEMQNDTLRLVLLATGTSVAYAAILLWVAKVRRGVGTDEVLCDYRDTPYTSFRADMERVWRRERCRVILMVAVISGCLLLNTFDALVIGQKTISHITFPFATMCLYSTCFPTKLGFVGYFISAAVIVGSYLMFVGLYRKKQYRIWLNREGR